MQEPFQLLLFELWPERLNDPCLPSQWTILLFFPSGFSVTDTDDSQDSRITTCSRTFRYLFATLHLKWLSGIFNRNSFNRWDLPPYWITIWLIDCWCNVCLFTQWFDSRFLLHQFDMGNRWIWTRIDCHSCITNEPINQVF